MAVSQGHGHGCDFIMEFPWVTLNSGSPLSIKHSRVDYGFKHYFIECPMQSGSREDLFGILHNYTDDKSTSTILNIILQGVNIRYLNFKIIEAVSKYILESNRFT